MLLVLVCKMDSAVFNIPFPICKLSNSAISEVLLGANTKLVPNLKLRPLSPVHKHVQYLRLTVKPRALGSHCGAAPPRPLPSPPLSLSLSLSHAHWFWLAFCTYSVTRFAATTIKLSCDCTMFRIVCLVLCLGSLYGYNV